MGDGTAVSKTGADLLGNRRFESFPSTGKSSANLGRSMRAPKIFPVGLRVPACEIAITVGGQADTLSDHYPEFPREIVG
jgi:hypothetical protein